MTCPAVLYNGRNKNCVFTFYRFRCDEMRSLCLLFLSASLFFVCLFLFYLSPFPSFLDMRRRGSQLRRCVKTFEGEALCAPVFIFTCGSSALSFRVPTWFIDLSDLLLAIFSLCQKKISREKRTKHENTRSATYHKKMAAGGY